MSHSGPSAVPIVLSEDERAELVRGRGAGRWRADRARIILACAEGMSNAGAAQALDISAQAMLRDGIADEVILEDADAAARPAPFLRSLGSAIEAGLRSLLAQEAAQRNAQWTRRYQALSRAGGTAPPAATA
jgi:hypothetical protein